MAPCAFMNEGGILAIRPQVNTPPTGPSPAIGASKLLCVLDHQFDLPEFPWNNEALCCPLLQPGDFGKPGSVRPRINIPFPSRLHGNVISENKTELAIVSAIRYSEQLPSVPAFVVWNAV